MEITEKTWQLLLAAWVFTGLIIFIILLYIPAPYGRHTRKGWGPGIPNRLGWVIMEMPSMIVFALFFLSGNRTIGPVAWIFFVLWVGHYINRSLVFPFRTKTSGKQMPLVIALFAVFFNLVNGAFNGSWFSTYGPVYTVEWLTDLRFIAGMVLFVAGAWINISSDQILLKLRKGGDGSYKIPGGGLFRYVSCPNFFGEILEWTGFAVMTWSPAALAFALWTIFNLVPRAMEHHRWYRKRFPDYPEGRKAVVPGIV